MNMRLGADALGGWNKRGFPLVGAVGATAVKTVRLSMRIFLVLTTLLQLAISPAMAQTPQSAASRADALSLEQKTKISELITRQTPPLAASSFSIAVDSVVPADIEVHALPAEA